MAVSDSDQIQAWRRVLALSWLESGQVVTILTSAAPHPPTLFTAMATAASMGVIVPQVDLPPVNGEKSLSRDPVSYLGTTPLTGNRAAIAALKESDFVLDSLGSNNEADGNYTTACHIDTPVRNCTIRLDGEHAVTKGKKVDGKRISKRD
jgi:hypothetical protein